MVGWFFVPALGGVLLAHRLHRALQALAHQANFI